MINHVQVNLCVCLLMYVCVCIERETETERDRVTERHLYVFFYHHQKTERGEPGKKLNKILAVVFSGLRTMGDYYFLT